MVKLTEVEDEHFTTEKPIPTKEALLVSDNEDDEDFTDTGMPSHYPSIKRSLPLFLLGANIGMMN